MTDETREKMIEAIEGVTGPLDLEYHKITTHDLELLYVAIVKE